MDGDQLTPDFDLDHLDAGDVLTVTGEVDLASSPELEALIGGVPADRLLVVDLSGCTYLDSSVLSVFVRVYKSRGTSMCLVVPSDARIRRLFELTKLDGVLTVVPTRAAAFA